MNPSLYFPAFLVATLVTMIIGSLWYSPLLFMKPWLKALGKSDKGPDANDMKKSAGSAMAGMLVAALVMNYILSHFIQYTQSTTFADGLVGGFWIWLGFIAATHVSYVLFENRSWTLYAINMGYYFVTLLICGGIFAAWRG